MQLDAQRTTQPKSDLLAALSASHLLGKKRRVGFILPEAIIEALNDVTNKSQFVSLAIAKAIEDRKKQENEKKLAQAYQAFAENSAKIAEDWHTLDLHDWDNL